MIPNDGWLSEWWKHQGILFIFLTASVAPVWHKQNHRMFLEHQCVLSLISVKAMSLKIIWIFWMLVFCFYFVCLCGMVWLLAHPKGYIALGQSRWWTRVLNFPTDAQPTSGKVSGSIGQLHRNMLKFIQYWKKSFFVFEHKINSMSSGKICRHHLKKKKSACH